jgi:hypothetical protein
LDVAAELHRTGARTRLVVVTTFARSGYLRLAAWDGADLMTDRERDVLRLAADGLPNTDIAARLHLAEGTRAELPLDRDQQARHPQPHRGRPGSSGSRLALNG